MTKLFSKFGIFRLFRNAAFEGNFATTGHLLCGRSSPGSGGSAREEVRSVRSDLLKFSALLWLLRWPRRGSRRCNEVA